MRDTYLTVSLPDHEPLSDSPADSVSPPDSHTLLYQTTHPHVLSGNMSRGQLGNLHSTTSKCARCPRSPRSHPLSLELFRGFVVIIGRAASSTKWFGIKVLLGKPPIFTIVLVALNNGVTQALKHIYQFMDVQQNCSARWQRFGVLRVNLTFNPR